MGRRCFMVLVAAAFASAALIVGAQQVYQLPDVRNMKLLTSKMVDRARDIPGAETTVDYYSAPNGQIITTYSYRGRCVAFSTHSNDDLQKTYRLFMDQRGDRLFVEVNRSATWQLPAWVK
jgi:hypothetical protein